MRWKHTIDLTAQFEGYEEERFKEFQKETVEIIRQSVEKYPELEEFCDRLQDAVDPDDWDDVWGELCDWCDEYRVWLGSV